MWTKFSWHTLDELREGLIVVYLSDYKLLNKYGAPQI